MNFPSVKLNMINFLTTIGLKKKHYNFEKIRAYRLILVIDFLNVQLVHNIFNIQHILFQYTKINHNVLGIASIFKVI